MMIPSRILFISVVACGLAQSQETYLSEITRTYGAVFSAMREAKTKTDIEKMVAAIDVPEWQGLLPEGGFLTRSEAVAALTGLLAVAPENRPIPRQQILYAKETSWNALVVYWVYRQTGDQILGSLARDTWVKTALGWRRMRHEKLFPDRPLIQSGKGSILPTP